MLSKFLLEANYHLVLLSHTVAGCQGCRPLSLPLSCSFSQLSLPASGRQAVPAIKLRALDAQTAAPLTAFSAQGSVAQLVPARWVKPRYAAGHLLVYVSVTISLELCTV